MPYTSPFLTCTGSCFLVCTRKTMSCECAANVQVCVECNAIAFIDAVLLDESKVNGSLSVVYEAIPKCLHCGRTHTWKVGARNLHQLIVSNALEAAERQRRELEAGIIMQAYFRRYAAMKRYNILVIQKRKCDYLRYMAASMLASSYRGRLDRRRATTVRYLMRIKSAHPIIQREALKRKRETKLFWYSRKPQVTLLYQDYRVLVLRTGNKPPRHIVERNIRYIYENVHYLECYRATLIQQQFRGMLGRKFIQGYRKELAWIFEQRYNATFTIQRVYRRYRNVRLYLTVLKQKTNRDRLEIYLEAAQKETEFALRAQLMARVKSQYVMSRRQELTGKVFGTIEYGPPSQARIYRGTKVNRQLLETSIEMLAHCKNKDKSQKQS